MAQKSSTRIRDLVAAFKAATNAFKASPFWRRLQPGDLDDNLELKRSLYEHRMAAVEPVLKMMASDGYKHWQEWCRTEIDAKTNTLLLTDPTASAQLLQLKGEVVGAKALGLNGPAIIVALGQEAEQRLEEMDRTLEQKARRQQPTTQRVM